MIYQIKYKYQTGNSFNIYDEEDILELEFNNLDVAKANLKRIEEHYEMYNKWISYSKDKDELVKQCSSKDWFVNDPKLFAWEKDNKKYKWAIDEKRKQQTIDQGYEIGYYPDSTYAQNCIILYTDDNKPYQFWPSWCGYFERLRSVEIITKNSEDNDLKIEF